MIRSPLLLLVGCPYVFGPPDLTNVGEGDTPITDTVPEGDTDVDADTDTDTDTTPEVTGDPPVVVSFEVVPRMTQAVIHFAIADPDSNLVGSSLSLSDGSTDWTFGIPGDIDVWDPLGISTIILPMSPLPTTESWLDCNAPVHQIWTVIPVDLDGNVGAPVEASLDIAALGVLPEVGDNVWPTDQHTTNAEPPFMGCVTYELDPSGPGGPNQQLRRDFEGIGFTTPSPGDFVAELQWDTSNGGDIDLFVYWYPTIDANPFDGIADTIDSSVQNGPSMESATWSATGAEGWLVDFPFFQLLGNGEAPFEAQFLVTLR